MLTFRQLDDAGDAVVRLFAETERAIINDMARRIAKSGQITDTANWQALRLEQRSMAQDNIIAELSRALRKSEADITAMFDEAATRAIEFDDRVFAAAGMPPVPLARNAPLQAVIRAGLKKTLGTYQNLTRTTANTATQQFERALDLAHEKIISGAFTYQQAIKDGIRTLSENGIASITYPTGHTDYFDVAFRRAALTGINQTAAELQLANMLQLDSDLVETTAHGGARPEHAEWQGKVFSVSGKHPKYPWLYETQEKGGAGFGTGAGLCGWNCRHSFFPFIDGVSEPAYTANELRALNEMKVTYNGQEIGLYEATQQQRHIERQIRKWKREDGALEAAGLDNTTAHAKVREWQAKQRDFIGQTGLRRDYFRERGGKQFTNAAKSGIITLDKTGRETFAKMDYSDLAKNNIQASNLAVRQWYKEHVSSILDSVDSSLPLEERAREAFSLRNQYRTEARNLMSNQTLREELDMRSPNAEFDKLLQSKMKNKNLTREEALKDIIKTASISNPNINKELGV